MEALDLQLQQTKDRCARQRLRVGRRDRHHRTRRNALSAMGASPCHGCAHSESPFVLGVMADTCQLFSTPPVGVCVCTRVLRKASPPPVFAVPSVISNTATLLCCCRV